MREAWTTAPDSTRQPSRRLTEFLKQQTVAEGAGVALEKSILAKGFDQFRQMYDRRYAGFGEGPKFPRPATFNFLLRYWRRFGEKEALRMTLETLRRMAESGMYDHIGGGFHPYLVDVQGRAP